MRTALRLTLCFLLPASVYAQLCPDEGPVANYTGTSTMECPCFLPGEQAGAVFHLPPSAFPIEILKLRIGWGSQFGGSPPTLEQAIHVYPSGLPNPGAPLFTLPGPTLNDGQINDFDIESLPGQVLVNSGPFTVTVEFLNQSSGSPFTPAVVHDNNGCQAGRNAVLVPPGGWNDACPLGVTGDFLFEVVYRQVNCARCPPQPAIFNHTPGPSTSLPNFVPGEQAGSVFAIPPGDLPAEIVEVGVGWASMFGGAPASLEQAIHVYQGGLPSPGAPVFSLPGPMLQDGVVNLFDLGSLPGSVVVNSSPMTVTVEFLNQSSGNPFAPSVVYDADTCQAGKNAVFTVPGGWNDACPLGVPGDFVFEATYQPFSCTGAGRVPDGDRVRGTLLRVTTALGGTLRLDWGASCNANDTDYEVYEGTLGSYYSHVSKVCSTSGNTTATFTPGSGNTYYLVVPADGSVEGSYGVDSSLNQRPAGASSCLTQQIGSCP